MSTRISAPKTLRGRSSSFGAGHRSALADQVYERLRYDMLHAVYQPGEALSENGLAADLGVSRTPVREAVQRLARERLVDVLPQRGSYVALLSMQRIHEAIFVREAVETQVVRRIVQAPENPGGLRALERCIEQQAAALHADDFDATMAADDAFHRTLVELCGMAGAWSVVAPARDIQRRLRAIAGPELQAGEQALDDHRAIVGALRRRDGDLAQERVTAHLKRIGLLTRRIANLHPDYFEVDDRVNPAL